MTNITMTDIYRNNFFTSSVLESQQEVSRLSKQILSLAPTTSENTSIFAFDAGISTAAPQTINTTTSVKPANTEIKPLATNINPTVNTTATAPKVDTNTATITPQAAITPENSRQIATNQAGFGVRLSTEAQQAINSLNASSATTSNINNNANNIVNIKPAVRTEELMNGKVILPEIAIQDQIKSIFYVPNPFKAFEAPVTNLDTKRSSSGFFSSKGNEERHQKQKNSLNVTI